MQSGISASEELHAAFRALLTDTTQRGLLVAISSSPERLVPSSTIPSTASTLTADLPNLTSHLAPTTATYILLRSDAPSKFTAITFVPDAAPVRQKTLYASTRLTLVRELGAEHFPTSLFATSLDELTPSGWAAQEAHGALAAPLTREEAELEGIKEAEAAAGAGTARRPLAGASSGVSLPLSEEAVAALGRLRDGAAGLVQLRVDVEGERVQLAGEEAGAVEPAALGGMIEAKEPRYAFYAREGKVMFVYTCPPGSATIKQRMLYASSRGGVVAAAEKEGVKVVARMEAGSPQEIEADEVVKEMEPAGEDANGAAAGKLGGQSGRAFERPKRPGRR